MWQSRVEIEHYSVVYFNHVTTFEIRNGIMFDFYRIRNMQRNNVQFLPGTATNKYEKIKRGKKDSDSGEGTRTRDLANGLPCSNQLSY